MEEEASLKTFTVLLIKSIYTLARSVHGRPAKNVALGDAELVAGLVDEAADVDGRRDHLLAVLGAVLADLPPGSLRGVLDALLELLGRVDLGVVDPFLVLDLLVGGLE